MNLIKKKKNHPHFYAFPEGHNKLKIRVISNNQSAWQQ